MSKTNKKILSKMFPRRWQRRLFRIFSVVFLIVLAAIVYYKNAVKIQPPRVGNYQALYWQKEQLADSLWHVKRNYLRQTSSGLWEVYLQGKPFARGAAYGNLTQNMLLTQEKAFISKMRDFVPNQFWTWVLRHLIAWFNRNIDTYIPLEYKLEIFGESLYAPDMFNYIGPAYGRMLNYHAAHDIGHALLNARLVGCTSFAVSKSNSASGQLLIARNFDFNMGKAFAKNKFVVFIEPDSGINHMFVSWPGFLGCVSGMNQSGLTVTLNAAPSKVPYSAKTPISIVARQILQYAHTIEEAYAIAQKSEVFVSELLLIGSAIDKKAVIIEKTPTTTKIYKTKKPILTCSNHFQSDSLRTLSINDRQFNCTSTKYRKKRINQLVNKNLPVSIVDAAKILRNRRGLDGEKIGLGNENAINQLYAHHGILFLPEENKVWVSANPFQMGQFLCYDLDEVFSIKGLQLLKNKPLNTDSLTIPPDTFLDTEKFKRWQIYNVKIELLQNVISGEMEQSFSLQQLDKIIALNPHFYKGYVLAAKYCKKTGNKKAAIDYYKAAIKKNIPIPKEKTTIKKALKGLLK